MSGRGPAKGHAQTSHACQVALNSTCASTGGGSLSSPDPVVRRHAAWTLGGMFITGPPWFPPKHP